MTSRPDRMVILSLGSLLVAVMFLVFGTNLQGVLLPLLGHERGTSMVLIGLFSAGWSMGFVLACICVGQMLGRFGHVRAFLGLALISAVATALLPLFPNDWAWVGLRVITGFCFGGLSAIVEGWLVEQAGSGIGFASYMVVNLLASLLGTLSLGVIDVAAATPLLLAAAAVALSAVPIAFGRLPRPPIRPVFRPRLGLLIRRSPLGTAGCIGAGVITGVIGGLAPVFGMMSALSMRADTLMLAANSIGGAIAYLPLSMLAEKLGQRTLLTGVILLGLLVCAPLALMPHLPPAALIGLMGAFGFAQYPIYGLCVGIANREAPDRPAAHIAGELVLLFGLGTIVGPLVGSQVLRGGTASLFVFVAFVLVLLLIGSVGLKPRAVSQPLAEA